MKKNAVKNTVIYTIVVLVLGLAAALYFAGEPTPDRADQAQKKDNTQAERSYAGTEPAAEQGIANDGGRDAQTQRPDLTAPEASPHTAKREWAEESEYSCDFDHFVGQMVSDLPLEELERPYRVLETGSMYTMDYVPERINIFTDEKGEVVRIKCG